MKELKIIAIKEGTVIDHLPSNVVFNVVKILKLEKFKSIVTVAANLNSKKLGSKGIIKIGDKLLSNNEINAIAIIAPNAIVNIIKDYKVIKKISLSLPKDINSIMQCSNPECITKYNKIENKFRIINKNPLMVRCHYCERIMEESDIIII